MADVYEGEDRGLCRRVAVKALHPEHARTDDQRRRFSQEALLGAAIDHPHVMPILDRGEARLRGSEPILFLVMPRCEGVSLRHVLLDGVLPSTRFTLDPTSSCSAGNASAIQHWIPKSRTSKGASTV